MNEIVKLVSDKVGISEEQAKMAVDVVVSFLKTKLPAPLASQLDGVLAGGGMPDLGSLTSGLGGLFGK